MDPIKTDSQVMIPCPFHCSVQFHPVGTKFCPFTGNRLPSLPFTILPLDNNQNSLTLELLQLLKKARGEYDTEWRNFYIFPEIPLSLRTRAAAQCQLTKDQQQDILGIIDLTLLGSTKCCLVFGQQALFYRNPRFSRQPGIGTILYRHIKNAVFETFGKFDIEIKNSKNTSLYINIAILWNSQDKKNRLLELLKNIAKHSKTKDKKTADQLMNKKKIKKMCPQRRLK